jgi:glycosyltransferase involved in cell wall biosynthesis
MKLLIITQKVDINDDVLGFFHRWIEEFAKHCEKVTVICLQKGEYNLPGNAEVFSLGKEDKRSRAAYLFNFYSLIWKKRKEYDVVFVHMNPEYVVLGGLVWKLLKKKIALWYTHKSVTLRLRIAEKFADKIFTASKESFRLPSDKVEIVGHGIDIDFFMPDQNTPRGNHWLSVGRLTASKRHDLAIRAAYEAGVPLRIAGEGPERENLKKLADELGADVALLGPLTQVRLRDEYRRAAKLVHRSETGSLDKVVLEAAACGCPVDTTDPALAQLPFSPEYVRDRHSLYSLIPNIINSYGKAGQ